MSLLITLWEVLESFLRGMGTKAQLGAAGASPDALQGSLTMGVDLRTGYDRQSSEDAIRATIVLFAEAQVGEVYKYGIEHSFDEADPEGWDCSELLQNAYERAGLSYPDGCVNQKPVVAHRRVLAPKPGDPFFYGPNAKGIPHTGLYTGDGYAVNALGGKVGHVVKQSVLEIEGHARFEGWFRHPDLAYPAEDRA